MKYLRLFEQFGSDYSEKWSKTKDFLHEKGLDVGDDSTIHYEFTKIEEDSILTTQEKASKITDFIKNEVGDYSEDYSDLSDFLDNLFSN